MGFSHWLPPFLTFPRKGGKDFKRWQRRKKSSAKFKNALVIILLYLSFIIADGLLEKPVASDLAVVLGNEVLSDGQPSERLKARLDCAVSLYRNHMARHILTSGGIGKSGYDEATVMAQYLRGKNIPAADILIDSQGVNTMATARNTAALMQKYKYESVIAVSQYYHIARTLLAFHKVGIAALSADHARYFEWGDLWATLREAVAIPVYLAKMPGIESMHSHATVL